MGVEKTVFISYRRTNKYMARAVYQDLVHNGFDVFLDFENIDAGSFEQVILNQIAARAHFIVVLTPSALERCSDPNDMLRREIEYALEVKRNIVPLMFEGFNFGDVQKYLVNELTVLSQYNALNVPADYFDEAMGRLRGRFLNKPLEIILHPTPKADEAAVQQIKTKEAQRPIVTEEQLTAEQWFERGLRINDNSDEEIACYTEAIRLYPKYSLAYNNRAIARRYKKDLTGAIADYNIAIQLNPKYASAYNNRGLVREDIGDIDGAISDYDEAIRLDPRYANAYRNRGIMRRRQGDLDGAIADYDEAIRLDPHIAISYQIRGIVHEKKGDLAKANADYREYIDRGGTEVEIVERWITANEKKLRGNGG